MGPYVMDVGDYLIIDWPCKDWLDVAGGELIDVAASSATALTNPTAVDLTDAYNGDPLTTTTGATTQSRPSSASTPTPLRGSGPRGRRSR